MRQEPISTAAPNTTHTSAAMKSARGVAARPSPAESECTIGSLKK
jgi:hypothetical protein